jgi:hypothetical protein
MIVKTTFMTGRPLNCIIVMTATPASSVSRFAGVVPPGV